ncbi:phage terminase large subunit-like protein [Sporomusaceae bacterium BoRhaA]|uniref:terminase large subunit n=1 Tax=Pelorhabdus rhamnosifermentans TaxID=2772457 RepID=UPI001C061CBD|nr:terminase TerL endonuclease subunit [Pelorhabdus rhamnosifermentans]MBU2703887.1 phage terminase large subunit-like protein [Pelorhabdus rhamnosifermentans]
MNFITEYANEIKSGRIIVGNKVRKVYFHLIAELDDPASEWEYDEHLAEHAINFIERYCKHSKGKLGGKPLLLELWQKALVAATFGVVHKKDRTRRFQEVMLVVGRKNGKSVLASAIGLYMMIADGEPGAEVFAAATMRDQAKIIWLEAKRMVNKSPDLRDMIKPLVAELVGYFNDSFFKPLGSDSDTLDGLNVHCALLDEIHAWKTKALYDVIFDGTSAREQPLIFITSTAGIIRESIYDIKYDEAENMINGFDDPNIYKNERFFPVIYELDSRKEWTDPHCWAKANPGLGTIKQLKQLKAKVEKAQANPRLVSNLLCKDFNLRQTSSEAFLTFEQLNNEATFDITQLKPRYGIGGVDLSITTDLTAAAVLFKVVGDETIYCKHMYWLPEDLLETREQDDKIPYSTWRDMGLLRTTPGNKVNYKFVVEWFIEMRDVYDVYIPWIGYDYFSAEYFVQDLKEQFGEECPEPVHQGAKTLSGPLMSLAADLDAKKINYENNPVTKWCMSNVAVTEDRNASKIPCKTSNQRRRIDGFAAMLDAYVVLERHLEDYTNMI